ncbi:IclR family transcriptional regulator [Haladaptatus caseinilyticus]|uniref:IclR family transcriptional regulator n=1 Tax=Haladaptatus caseinilyticus TaxID=2993314 RepID=UPI00224B0F11|nr:IclR family transcriptional regulator [Haladaptatus caseinilyticus]
MTPSTKKAKNKIKSIDTSFDIIEYLMEEDGAGVTELADNLGRSKSTIHCHLNTLEQRRYVTQVDDVYRVGLRFLNLGGYAAQSNEIYRLTRSEVDELAAETGLAAQLVVEEHGKGIFVHQSRGNKAVQTDSRIGTERYLHCTAFGKAMLAYYSPERVRDILDRHGMSEQTAKTTTSPEELLKECEEIRSRNAAFDDNEQIEGIRCVAVPILTNTEDVLGAISVSGSTRHMDNETFRKKIPELIQHTVRVIEINYANI